MSTTLLRRLARLEAGASAGTFDLGRFFHDLLGKSGEEATAFESYIIPIGGAETEAAISRWFRSLGLDGHHERE